jgi:hypothetical protein
MHWQAMVLEFVTLLRTNARGGEPKVRPREKEQKKLWGNLWGLSAWKGYSGLFTDSEPMQSFQ